MVTPFVVVFLQFMDLWFLIFTVFFKSIIFIFKKLLSKDTLILEDWLDKVYEFLFEMQKLDV